MSQINNLEETSSRGLRKVGVGISNLSAKALSKGFNFNNKAVLGSILYNLFAVDVNTGEITLADLVPINDVSSDDA